MTFAPHPNPLPMNLAIRCLIAVKSIVAKFMGRGDVICRYGNGLISNLRTKNSKPSDCNKILPAAGYTS